MKKKVLIGYVKSNWIRHFRFSKTNSPNTLVFPPIFRSNAIWNRLGVTKEVKVRITLEELPHEK